MKLQRDKMPPDDPKVETTEVAPEGHPPPSGMPVGVEHKPGEVPLCGNEPLP